MAIEVRGIEPGEVDDLIRTVANGFGGHINERDLGIERMVLEPERTIAAVEGDRFVGGSTICSFSLHAPGVRVPCGGITSVAVLPTHRRQGALAGMMRRILEDLREAEPVSALWASDGGIYGRFGYGVATLGTELSIQRERSGFLHPHQRAGSVRLVDRAEAMKLFPGIFERAAGPGFIDRDDAWWRYRFEVHDFRLIDGYPKEYFFVVHEGEEGPDGYAAYRIKQDWDKGATMEVEELIAVTPGAYADLWRYCFDVDLVAKVDAIHRGIEEPLFHLLAEPSHLGMKIFHGLWIRLVRVPEALASRRYRTEGSLRIGVRDPFCPWNEGVVELEGGPDGAEARPTEAEPELEVDVAVLGAAFLGGTSFAELARAGVVKADEDVVRRADAMFGWHGAPWCPSVF